ncbi:MAG: CHAT domain-containing protein [Thermodesulfovibrionales bacterium]
MRQAVRTTRALFILLMVILSCPSAFASEAGGHLQKAEGYLDRGDFEQAIRSAAEADRISQTSGELQTRIKALSALARAFQLTGHLKKAEETLTRARALSEQSGTARDRAGVLNLSGSLNLTAGQTGRARTDLELALTLAQTDDAGRLRASISINLGNLSALEKKFEEAHAAYTEALELSTRLGDKGMTAQALLNMSRMHLMQKNYAGSRDLLSKAYPSAQGLPPSHDKAFLLIGIARGLQTLKGMTPDFPAELEKLALDALQSAAATAREITDHRALSYGYGYLGELYEQAGDYGRALQVTRRAVMEAERPGMNEARYLWHWQSGRILKKMGLQREAITAFRLAVRSLEAIRGELSSGCFTCGEGLFSDKIEPVYFGLADLLLEQAGRPEPPGSADAYLREARQVLESMKGAELYDYFRDPCVDAYLSKQLTLEQISAESAVLYVIPLAGRLELLLSTGAEIRRYPVDVRKDVFTAEVKAFRKTLEKRTTREYMVHGRRLYEWLIAPIRPELAAKNIGTLVIIPDRWLRTIPVAALHDGKDFLISSFAVATTQGLTLTDPKPFDPARTEVLTAGLTESVQGYPPLASVSQELADIGGLYPGRQLKDRTFLSTGFMDELEGSPFQIVHIASHGEFSGDSRESFLLSWDERLTMDQLERSMKSGRFRANPVEILTLSACQTASGDDRAALGLAGVAVKAGAKSALATLWYVSDEASSMLVVEFYREFRQHAVSKARALQNAQLRILKDSPYRHPYYWAPFLLIGNWL